MVIISITQLWLDQIIELQIKTLLFKRIKTIILYVVIRVLILKIINLIKESIQITVAIQLLYKDLNLNIIYIIKLFKKTYIQIVVYRIYPQIKSNIYRKVLEHIKQYQKKSH
jgi:hypothetical protein